jgi:hypothetical protein
VSVRHLRSTLAHEAPIHVCRGVGWGRAAVHWAPSRLSEQRRVTKGTEAVCEQRRVVLRRGAKLGTKASCKAPAGHARVHDPLVEQHE